MGLNDMFTFRSPEEKKRISEEYQQRIFPLGIEQREMALSVLRELIRSKITDNEILFSFIVCKQKYLDKKEEVIPEIKKYLKKRRLFDQNEISFIIALTLLDSEVESLAAYPTKSLVISKAGTIVF